MTPSEKLLKRLREELKLDISPGSYIKRTRAGYWQKSQGAFIWIIVSDKPSLTIGSCFSVTDLLKCKNLTISDS